MAHPNYDPSSKNTQALLVAATEADRLLLNTANNSSTTATTTINANDEKHSTTKRQHPAFQQQDDKSEQEVLNAVNVLLLVSNDPVLQNFIATSSTRLKESTAASNELVAKQIATIHRAFLSLTKQCLDHCSNDAEHPSTMLVPALELTRRAHVQLNLPFHWPLYKRLMEIAATCTPTGGRNTNAAVDTIVEIVSFGKALSPEVVRSAALYKPVLTIWIRQGRLKEVVRLLQAMENRFQVQSWDRPTVTDIYVELHRAVKDSFQTTGRRSFPEDLCAMIVEALESAVLFLCVEKSRQKVTSLRDIEQALEHLDEETISQMTKEELRRQLDVLSMFRDRIEDEDDDDDEYYNGDTDEEVRAGEMGTDPLDFVVHSILTKRVVTPAARREFVRMITNTRSSSTRPPVPKVVTVPTGPQLVRRSKDRLVVRTDPPPARRVPLSFRASLYGEDPNSFPDLTAQLVSLNRGRRIELTPAYEEYLYKRFEDDDDDDDDYDTDEEDVDDDFGDDDDDEFGDDDDDGDRGD